MPHRPIRKRATRYAAIGLAVSVSGLSALPVSAQEQGRSQGNFTVVETGRSYASLQSAVNAIGGRRGTISIAPGVYRQCAVQESGIVTYRAEQPGSAIFEGAACEGKASLVLRGRAAGINGLTFRGIAVRDGNGAGIRLEQGDLEIGYTRFEDSQQGILTANDPSSRLVIIRSTFSGLGTCENSAGCAHSVYVGNYGELIISESRFERGTGGHYVKARSGTVTIQNSSFDDAAGRGTNYMIDLPAGARGSITGNWFVQGRDKENYSAFIAVGAEDLLHSSDGLQVAGNRARFVPGLHRSSAFVADWTGAKLAISGNQLAEGLERYERR